MGAERVVPLWAGRVVLQAEALHRLIGDPLAGLVAAAPQPGADLQAGVGGRPADVADQGLEAAQGFARPVEADVAEEPVLDGVPLRAAARVMADSHRETVLIAQVLLERKRFSSPTFRGGA